MPIAALGDAVGERLVHLGDGGVVGPVGIAVPDTAPADTLAGPAPLRVPDVVSARDRRPVGLDDQRVVGRRVAGVRHRLGDVADRAGDLVGAGGDGARREPVLHVRVVVAVVLPPPRRRQPVGDAALDDVGEAEVVGADQDRDRIDVVVSGELLELYDLALAGGAVVPVEARLEIATGLGVRTGARAGQVERHHSPADVGLRRLRAVAARCRLGGVGRVVEVGVRSGVVAPRGIVGVARPATRLAGDRRVSDRHDPTRWRRSLRRRHTAGVGGRNDERTDQRRCGTDQNHQSRTLDTHRTPPSVVVTCRRDVSS